MEYIAGTQFKLFSVERSIDGIHFTQIGEVKAGGNSSVARNYQFNDQTRLKELITTGYA